MRSYFHAWLTLIYWVFMKPTALRDHLRQVAPELSEHEQPPNHWYVLRSNKLLRRFQLHAMLVLVITPFLLNSIIGGTITALGGNFNWIGCINGIVLALGLSLILSLTWGLTLGLTWGLPSGLTLAMGWGLSLGFVGGLTGGISSNLVVGIAWGLAIGTAGSLAVALESGLAWGVVGGPVVGLVGGLAGGMTGRLTLDISIILAFSISVLMGVFRFPFALLELVPAIRAYHQTLEETSQQAETGHVLQNVWKLSRHIERSPVYFDELLILPQPYLAALLLTIARCHLRSGLRHIARVASNPFQRWAAQRAIRTLLEHDRIPFYLIIHELLTIAEPYHAIGGSEYPEARDSHFTTRLLLAEIANVPALRGASDERLGFSEALAKSLTLLFRIRGNSPYEPLALAYLYLLTSSSQTTTLFQRVLPIFEKTRTEHYGEETHQIVLSADAALRSQYLAEVAQCQQVIEPLLEIKEPLRPSVISVFSSLYAVTMDAMVFLSGEHPVNLRDALLKAQGKLEEARRLTEKVSQPEQRFLIEVIEHWRRMFVTEGEQIAEGVEVEVLPNPYVAGRALGPADGKIFVGRHDIFRQIEETLHTGVTVVLYGQRRIGKTSILLHLRNNMSHTLLPVYFNLQLFQAGSTAGLLSSLSRTISEHLEKANCSVPILPTLDTFNIEPFLTFDQFLSDVERSVYLGQRVVLVFDEFEELERQVTAGHVDNRIFTFLRGLTQTRHGIVLLFAGLHTLEQMSYDYWHPFFLSVKPIKVSYLSQSEAWGLITSPIDEFPLKYDKAATDRIIAATHRQPYLIQALCFNLVTLLNNPLHRSNRTTVEHINMVLEQTIESGTYYFDDYFWGHSNPQEQLTLAIVADVATHHQHHEQQEETHQDGKEQNGWVDFSIVEQQLGREQALKTLKNLYGRDILEERAVGKKLSYRFQVELLRIWVARTKPLARILLERSLKGDSE